MQDLARHRGALGFRHVGEIGGDAVEGEEPKAPICRVEKQKVVKIDEAKKAANEKAKQDAKDAEG
jgi:hypothetical protein